MFGKDKLLREGTEAKALVLDKKVGSVASEAGRDGLKAVVSFGQAGTGLTPAMRFRARDRKSVV